MLISSHLLKSHNFRIRKKFLDFVEEIKDQGANVFLFSAEHPSGQKLKDITGIAAILRYELDLDEFRNNLINEE